MVDLIRSDEIQDLSTQGKFNTRKASLGDGYKRAARNGINAVMETKKIRWIPHNEAEANEIIDFLKEYGGDKAITWTPPNRTVVQTWLVVSWTDKYDGPILISVDATLEEFFGA